MIPVSPVGRNFVRVPSNLQFIGYACAPYTVLSRSRHDGGHLQSELYDRVESREPLVKSVTLWVALIALVVHG